MNAICLIIDRLHVGYLGAYGNAWIETPMLDRLAFESFVFDQALIDTPRLRELYRSYWHGWHGLSPDKPPQERPTLVEVLGHEGVHTALLTDESLIARHRLAGGFDEFVEIAMPEQAELADDVDATHLGRCFTEILSWLETPREPFFLWCHLSGMGVWWDAPYAMRERFAEPGDPPPPRSAEVPGGMLAEDYDPDMLLGVSQAYAGQVALLDVCMGALMEALRESPLADETLVALLSARGFPLGEHRRVGPCDEAVYGELVQIPMMLRFPDGTGAACRSSALVHPADLRPTLLEWWGIDDEVSSPSGKSLMPLVGETGSWLRDRLCLKGPDGQRAIRTPAWYLRRGDTPELFAKPDDRWEVNNVADRCREVAEELDEEAERFEQHLQSGTLDDLPPLNEVLLRGLE